MVWEGFSLTGIGKQGEEICSGTFLSAPCGVGHVQSSLVLSLRVGGTTPWAPCRPGEQPRAAGPSPRPAPSCVSGWFPQRVESRGGECLLWDPGVGVSSEDSRSVRGGMDETGSTVPGSFHETACRLSAGLWAVTGWAGGQPRPERNGYGHLVSWAEVPGQELSTFLATCSALRARRAKGRSLSSGGARANVQTQGEGGWI